ncbi:uncharacterized protein LOC113233298 [Hyposmocoma kahamanoa]|uniref:uncharacterized protein LOC113233298 n=1 Tax=Hyposmocoma kahamanoa TaxID=1477025 RepID=UPI000E6D71ED|nr:uncharacterized protein LOC113233298 [Hyposmocoma kahamanoa]
MELHEDPGKHRVRVVFTRKMEERKLYMEELKNRRYQENRRLYKEIRKRVGPRWYQALSTPQRVALDTLQSSMYQDMLEARPGRSEKIIKVLGLQPRPSRIDLLSAMYYGKGDPKEMFAQLYQMLYGFHFSTKRASYTLNQRLILSAIFYLGLDNLIVLLRERFKPDPKTPSPPVKKKKPPPILQSPYLQKLKAVERWSPKVFKPREAQPLPLNLGDLNEPYEEEPIVPKPPPPPPPPPPPKKKLPQSYCEKLAGYTKLEAYRQQSPVRPLKQKKDIGSRANRIHASKLIVNEGKKTYGLGLAMKCKVRRKKPKAPRALQYNGQYLIKGVHIINGSPRYVLEAVVNMAPLGEFINGGHVFLNGVYLTIHKGYTSYPAPPVPPPCDCLEKWAEPVFRYVKNNKCQCGHHYDYGNDGEFDISDPQYFVRPSVKGAPMHFDYNLIYERDEKTLTIEKEIKKAWDTDSILWVDDGIVPNPKEKRRKRIKKSSKTCLGEKPTISNYLKCALRYMRQVNIAARLPDVYLTQELQEWMRYRIYGPFTPEQKKRLLLSTTYHWAFLNSFPGHVTPKSNPEFSGETTWKFKNEMRKKFKKYTSEYKIRIYKAHAYVNNLFWATMCQAQFPDKHFREIFFSYLISRIGDLQINHPYSTMETAERRTYMEKKRYICSVGELIERV